MAPPCTTLRPTPPVPKTAMEAPAGTRAVLSTAPTPVMTEQPTRAARSSGMAGSMRMADDSWTTVRDNAVHALWTAPLAMLPDAAELPRFLFGHSMGAVLALDYALAHSRELTAVAASAVAAHMKPAVAPKSEVSPSSRWVSSGREELLR